jgi:hypothetical protein
MALNVICLKHGSKYGPEYVNNLYNMVMRNLTIPHNFVCFTDNPENLNSNIQVRLLPRAAIQGWWWKPYIFKADHFSKGDINLFLDLDMVIINNIDRFIDYLPNQFVGLQDVIRAFRPDIIKLGSAIMRWPAGEYSDIWSNFEKNLSISSKLRGDQDWIWGLHHPSIKFFPHNWILSYKWEVRNRAELIGHGPLCNFRDNREVEVPEDTSILAFHGFPNPDQVTDKIIVDNWR